MQDKTTLGISEPLHQFIEALVEEVVINGEPFDTQKKWLRKYSEAEGQDYEALENSLNNLFEAIKELEEHESKSAKRLIGLLAKDCYLSTDLVSKLIKNASERRTQTEAEKKTKEKKEPKVREKAELKTKEKANRKATVEKKPSTNILNGHEYVDLGLPSGTLWATRNLNTPESIDYHNFAWGELEEKEVFSIETYRHGNGTLDSIREIGKNISGTQFDVAHVKWGGKWRMPSKEQMNELIECCTIEDSQDGFTFKSKKNGNSIYLPILGIGEDSEYIDGSIYWTGNEDGQYDAYCLYIFWDAFSSECCTDYYRKYNGGSIRPVALP